MNGLNEFTTGPLTLDEMMKIISLLENPSEAEFIRKALRFYEIPKTLRTFKWGENQNLMSVLAHYENPQNDWELEQMLDVIRGKTKLLEIGSSFGGTLRRMASVMTKGSLIVSVDLPVDSTPKFLNPQDSLKDTCRKIGLLGGHVELFMGNSHSKQVVEAVRAYGPFDFGFIDGDHSYQGMKEDWENYGPMCKVVGFHDIAGALPDCQKCWQEIKALGYRTEEFVSGESPVFGIGIVHREEGIK